MDVGAVRATLDMSDTPTVIGVVLVCDLRAGF